MGVEFLYIILIVVFLVIDDEDDAKTWFLFYVLGSGFQKKKNLNLRVIPTLIKHAKLFSRNVFS